VDLLIILIHPFTIIYIISLNQSFLSEFSCRILAECREETSNI
jgi:hypothetical protein